MEFSTLNGYKVKDKKAIRYYDNVELMKSDTTLKSGMYVKTEGYYTANDGGSAYYRIVETTDKYSEDLTNELKAELMVKDKVNVKQFGAKGNNEDSDYQAFIKAITFCKNSKYSTLYIPDGKYVIDNPIVIDFALNIEGNYSQYANQYEDKNNTLTVGSIIIDKYKGNEPLIKYEYQGSSNEEVVKRIWGVKISNIQFIGSNENDHVGLYLHRIGWEGQLENLRFKDFYHTALYLDRVYDTTIKSVNISSCGSHGILENELPNYAMVVTDSDNDTTNALHVFGLHIEGCRYDLKLDRSKNNEFIGCKFEDKANDSDVIDLVNPNILITSKAIENTFDSCMFVPIKMDRWKELNITSENAPYQILSESATNSGAILKITNCDFSSPSLQGSKIIKTGTNMNKTILKGNSFYVLTSETNAIDISNAIVSNNIFITWNIIKNITELANIKISKTILSDNIFKLVQQEKITESYCYESTGNNIVSNCQTENYNNLFKSSVNTDNVKYDKYRKLNNNTYASISGIISENIDWNNIIIDKSKFKYEEFYCDFSQSVNIKEITNGQLGDEITIVNNSNNPVILGGIFDYLGNRIVSKSSNTSSTLTLTGFQSAKLVKTANYWKVISTDGTIE